MKCVGYLLVGAAALLLSVLFSRGEIKIAVACNDNQSASPGFKFNGVPAPAKVGAASAASFMIVDGQEDRFSGGLAKLHDGFLPGEGDQPGENFFFAAGTDGGRLRIDLGRVTGIKQVNTYSWQSGSRGPQVYTLYGSDGAGERFNPEPKRGTDPVGCGWRLVAKVDTRPNDGGAGGQYGVSVSDSAGLVGKYRYLLFDMTRTRDVDPFGNTFYSEIQVIDSATKPAGAGERAKENGSNASAAAVSPPPKLERSQIPEQIMALADAGRFGDAESRLNVLLSRENSKVAEILTLRADIHAWTSRFQDAASDLEQAVKMDPDDHQKWVKLGLLLAWTGDMAKYKTCCKEMLRRFKNTMDPAMATRLAKTCLVMPSALDTADVAVAEKLADTAVMLTRPRRFFPWRHMTIGLAEYRRGELPHAAEIIDSLLAAMRDPERAGASPNGWAPCEADACFILAMTRQQLKESDKARDMLEQGRNLVLARFSPQESKDLRTGWWDVLFANMLMTEAGTSVNPPKPPQP